MKSAFIIVFIFSVLLVSAPDLFAQEPDNKRGYKGPVGRQAILSELTRGETVRGYVIIGDDLTDIIRQTDKEIKISDAVIEGGLDFSGLTVQNKIEIIGSEIRYDKENAFSIKTKHTQFGTISFRESAFTGQTDLSDSVFGNTADFSDVIFHCAAKFSDSNFQNALFFGAVFEDEVSFSKANFQSEPFFFGTAFRRGAYFSQSDFMAEADFSNVTFGNTANFSNSAFGNAADFSNVIFHGVANFSENVFKKEAFFFGTVFEDEAFFSRADFQKEALFFGAAFKSRAYFSRTTFNSSANFFQAAFDDKTTFFRAAARSLNFSNAEIPTTIKGRMDFRKAKISEAHFQDIIFEKEVDFSDAEFGVPTGDTEKDKHFALVFRSATFNSDAYFVRTIFPPNTALEMTNFKNNANFKEAVFKTHGKSQITKAENKKQNFSLSYVNFDTLLIKWDQLPDTEYWIRKTEERIKSFADMEEETTQGKKQTESEPGEKVEVLSQVLKTLEENFRRSNDLDDANKAYYHMKLAELEEAREGKDVWLRIQKESEWLFWGITCGYGTDIWRILLWSLLIHLIFTTAYFTEGTLRRSPPPPVRHDFTFTQRLFEFPRHYLTGRYKPRTNNALYNAHRFSMVILFKIGYRDTTISGRILGIACRDIVWLEWFLGIVVLAFIAVTLSNTLPIINMLITGLF